MAKVPHTKQQGSLRQLNVFVGEWEVEALVSGKPAGRNRVVWCGVFWTEGKQFLVQNS